MVQRSSSVVLPDTPLQRAGNPVANLIRHLRMDQNCVTVLLSSRDEEDVSKPMVRDVIEQLHSCPVFLIPCLASDVRESRLRLK